MHEQLQAAIRRQTGATAVWEQEKIQALWSGYGHILRVGLAQAAAGSVVVKHIQIPREATHHPRGWHTDIGHQRKLRSYQVETTWYQTYSHRSAARLPHCLGVETQGAEVVIVLEDLDAAGFSRRKRTLKWDEIAACLGWLAQFHASYLGQPPEGLWEVGTYWHLATRPQEWAVLDDKRLKAAAPQIDAKLNRCTYQTLVHGDAKLANFCFAPDGRVAGVDFQYTGGGCGMKDVAYFAGSCLDEAACERLEDRILDTYFAQLHQALGARHEALEAEWRALYRVAWADFHRFLKGWSPGHWKLTSYSERVTAEVIQQLS